MEGMTPIPNPVNIDQTKFGGGVKGMDFPTAIRHLIDGKRIARVQWSNADYCLLKDGWLKLFTVKEGEKLPNFHTWLINDGDLLGEDWIVLPDIN